MLNTKAAALALLHAFLAMDEAAPRTKAHVVAAAEFKGMCKAMDRLGLAWTDSALHLNVLEAVRAAGPRPPYSPMGRNVRREWDEATAARIAATLDGELNARRLRA